jgi:outer membrane receptor protein involved in Fe transport
MRSLKNRGVLFFGIVFSLWAGLTPTFLFGQAATASISGRVTDTSGAAVPDAQLTVKNTATSTTQTVNSDEQGRYAVPDLPIGPYEVTTTKSGFQTSTRSGVTLTVGSSPVIDFQLKVGQATETVNVSAEVAQVQTTTSAISSLVNQTQMRELPLNGRDFEQLILLAPGVATYPSGGSSALTSVANAYSIAGTRPEGYSNMLDGEDMLNWWQRNAGANVTGTSLGIEAIAEFQTLTNTYGAQYGGNGGVINAVSKSGTNVLHGSVYEFFRNSDLDARSFFDGNSVPPFRKNQYGASLGGPIKKNKVFFFVNYEGIQQVLDTTYPVFVPSAAVHQGIVSGQQITNINPGAAAMLALYPLPTSPTSNPNVGQISNVSTQNSPENFFVGRIDWNISDKDSLFGRYEIDYGNRTTAGGNNELSLWPIYDVTHNNFFTLGERHIFSPNLISQFTSSFSRPNTGETQPATHDALQLFTPQRDDVYVAMPNGISPLGGSFVTPFSFIQNKYTQTESLDWVHGSHDIKFGMSFRREEDNAFSLTYWNGFYIFLSLPNFLQGNPFSFTGAPNGGTNATRDARTVSLNPYIQDDWKVNSRLTVNLGLRYEWESNPVEAHNNYSNIVGAPYGTGFTPVSHAFISNPSNKNFDPRVGFAWDVFGDHKTSVRGGFGIFHDVYQTYTFESGYISNPPYLTENQYFPTGDPSFPTPFVGGGTPLLSQTNGTYYGINTTPYVLEYNLNVQREIVKNTLLTVGYTGTRGVHLLAFHDFNPPVPTVINGVDYFATSGGAPCTPTSGTCTQNPRLNPTFGSLDLTAPTSSSRYNGLLVSVEHKLSANFVMQFSYTYSHCIDTAYTYGGLGANNGSSAITNPYNFNADLGNCATDLRQVLSANVVYILPFHGNRWKEGWQFSGVQAWHTGVPFTLSDGDQGDLQNNFGSARPNVVAGCNVYANQSVTNWFNTACFQPQPYGTLGDLGRNSLVGPGYVDTDFGVMKNTRINERFNVQFRAELFNLFNHANFAPPSGAIYSAGVSPVANATANQITSIVGNARQTQFSLKLIF